MHTARSIAELVDGELDGPPDVAITGVASLDAAGPGDLTLITARRYAKQWPASQAGVALIKQGLKANGHDPTQRTLIIVPDAELAMVKVLEAFAPAKTMPEVGVHESAVVHDSATLGSGVRIGAHVTVGRDCEIGDNVILHAGVRIYSFVCIGEGTEIHGNAVIRERCTVGRHVLLHQNVSIGADGFGYRPAPDGKGLIKVPHIGTVEIGDEVEIGAGSCVDRGKFGATTVGAGTKIDNLVQVGHNCRIGRCCIIAGMAGFGGSVTLGDGVMVGGGAGIREQITVGDRAKVAAMSGVLRDVPAGESHVGLPAEEASQALRIIAATRRMAGLAGNDPTDRPDRNP